MNNSSAVCPVCGEGTLEASPRVKSVEHKGISSQLKMELSVCDTCGCEQADSTQLRSNKRRMVEFKKHAEGLLTGAEVREIRKQLELNQAEAAKVFGGGQVAFSKYENDDVIQSEAMDKLLRVAHSVPEARRFLVGKQEPLTNVRTLISPEPNSRERSQAWGKLYTIDHLEPRRLPAQHFCMVQLLIEEDEQSEDNQNTYRHYQSGTGLYHERAC